MESSIKHRGQRARHPEDRQAGIDRRYRDEAAVREVYDDVDEERAARSGARSQVCAGKPSKDLDDDKGRAGSCRAWSARAFVRSVMKRLRRVAVQ
jgi:hypothetical protein